LSSGVVNSSNTLLFFAKLNVRPRSKSLVLTGTTEAISSIPRLDISPALVNKKLTPDVVKELLQFDSPFVHHIPLHLV